MLNKSIESNFNFSEKKENNPIDTAHWTQIFNTALITTRVEGTQSTSSELYTLLKEPAFNALLTAIRLLAETKGLTEADAAKEMIKTFRRIDQVWSDLLIQEGFDHLKGN